MDLPLQLQAAPTSRYTRTPTRYIDPTNGSDANDGLTPATAWASLAAVTSESVSAGDVVGILAGSTVTVPSTHNAPVAGVVYTRYGPGDVPILAGDSTTPVINTNSKDDLTLEGVRIAADGEFALAISNSEGVLLDRAEVTGSENDNLIFTTNARYSRATRVRSHGGVEGAAENTCLEVKDGCHHLELDHFLAVDGAGKGVSIHDHEPSQALGDVPSLPYAIRVHHGISSGNDNTISSGGFGFIKRSEVDDETSRDVLFSHLISRGDFVGPYVEQPATVVSGSPHRLRGLRYEYVYTLNATNRAADIRGDVEFEHAVFDGAVYAHVRIRDPLVSFNHCTFNRGGTAAWSLRVDAPCAGLTLRNSILNVGHASEPIMIGSAEAPVDLADLDIDYNLYNCANPASIRFSLNGTLYTWAEWKALGFDANSPDPADPLFEDRGEHDFRLQEGSPASGAASDGSDLGATILIDEIEAAIAEAFISHDLPTSIATW